jgi:hypothetical protein
MTKEALKLALEALENHCGNYKLDDAGCERWDKAVTAINDALAQPEQEPVATIDSLEQEIYETQEQIEAFNAYVKRNPAGRQVHHTGTLGYEEDEWYAFQEGWNAALAQPPKPRNFCPRCGKRTPDPTTIHTCTPPRGLEMT